MERTQMENLVQKRRLNFAGHIVYCVCCIKRESEFALSLNNFSSSVWELGVPN